MNEIGDPHSVWSRYCHRFSHGAQMGKAHLGAYILCSLVTRRLSLGTVIVSNRMFDIVGVGVMVRVHTWRRRVQ